MATNIIVVLNPKIFLNKIFVSAAGQVASITIAPGKTLKIIATIVGPVKRFVGMEVMVTEINSDHCPIDPQVL